MYYYNWSIGTEYQLQEDLLMEKDKLNTKKLILAGIF